MLVCRNPNCAKENPDDLVFCKYCGRRLRELKNNSKKPIIILMGIAAMIILLISVKAIFSIMPKDDNIADIKNKEVPNITTDQPVPGVGGYKFVFIKGEGPIKELYIHNADGSIAKLTNSNLENIYPSWSPDGSKIAFERKEGNSSNIYVINVNGTGEMKLAEGHSPTWTPDGSRVFFFNKDPKSVSNILYSVKIDGTDLKPVTTTSDSYYMARYSPDGSKIALTKYSVEGWGIYTVGPDMSGRKTLSVSQNQVGDPSWSPDGTRIAYAGQNDGNSEIYTVDINKNITRLTTNQVPDISPSFTQDDKLIFTREEMGTANLYIIDSDGKNEKLLLKDASYASLAK